MGFKEIFFQKKVSVSYVIIIVVATVTIVLSLIQQGASNNQINKVDFEYIAPASCNTYTEQVCLRSYQFTRPWLLTDVSSESDNLLQLKNYLSSYIEEKKREGTLISASLGVRDLSNDEFIRVNGNEAYTPGSLLKLPVLITYLKQAEKNPELLEVEVLYDRILYSVPAQTYGGDSIARGKKYKVKELLHYMTVNSDNYATTILTLLLDKCPLVEKDAYQKLFTDLNIKKPDLFSPYLTLTVAEYSKFMRILYSASYLNVKNSEYALSLLAQGDFRDGFLKQLPRDVKVAHKFGESGTEEIKQLHEAGIFYTGEKTYLLIVMTKGNDVTALPSILGEISKYVYDNMTPVKNSLQ